MSASETSTHFREHDIEFLQKRSKLWLEAVLGEKYGDRTLPELISDGNLLYRVSKHITKEMTGASPGPQLTSPKTVAHLEKMSSGKYLPYANVDSFLKTCRKVGLTDVELFSPPDVVEGKDIRQVCTSIRTLARKARAQHIRVPDFEDVNRPLPMPKEKIEEIKGSLQHAHSSPVSPTVASPEEDIKNSERVRIISRFLSTTEEGKGSRPRSEPPSPVTPGMSKSLSSQSSPRPTRVLTKSVSDVGKFDLTPSLAHVKASQENFASPPPSKSSDELKPDKALETPSPEHSVSAAQPDEFPSPFSQKSLSSFRHRQPHFTKMSPSQSQTPDSAKELPVEVSTPDPKPEATLSSSDVSAPSTPVISSEHRAEKARKLPTLTQLGLGGYRHTHPHFSFKKSAEADSTDSKGLQSEANASKAPNGKPKGPSSNKIVENIPKSTTQQAEAPGRTPSGPATKGSPGTSAPAKKTAREPEQKAPGMQLHPKLWVPLAAGALAFVGTLLVVRPREPSVYEVKQGDTLSKISKQVGNENWEDLVKLNPNIVNPNLIYPSERIKLPWK